VHEALVQRNIGGRIRRGNRLASGMMTEPALLVSLDLAGTFIYALNGGLTAVHATRLDVVGVITLAMISGLGGGMIRDILLGALPPQRSATGATSRSRPAADWRRSR
jgi:Glycine transporter